MKLYQLFLRFFKPVELLNPQNGEVSHGLLRLEIMLRFLFSVYLLRMMEQHGYLEIMINTKM